MPEIAEVELKRRYCENRCMGKDIESLRFSAPEILKGISTQQLDKHFTGKHFDRTYRRGKFLFLGTDDHNWLILHFAMSGDITVASPGRNYPEYTRFTVRFENGETMCYHAMRKLGKIGYTEDPRQYMTAAGFGPDALRIDQAEFIRLLENRRSRLKALLLNQHFVSGIGNLYADEILYQCRLHPEFPVEQLTPEQRATLYETMTSVLQTSLSVDTDFSRLPDGFLLSHRRKDNQCPRGHGELTRIQSAGRTTYYCAECQKLPEGKK